MIHMSLSCCVCALFGSWGFLVAAPCSNCMPDPIFEPTLVHCLTQCGTAGRSMFQCTTTPARSPEFRLSAPLVSTDNGDGTDPRGRNLGSCCSWIYYIISMFFLTDYSDLRGHLYGPVESGEVLGTAGCLRRRHGCKARLLQGTRAVPRLLARMTTQPSASSQPCGLVSGGISPDQTRRNGRLGKRRCVSSRGCACGPQLDDQPLRSASGPRLVEDYQASQASIP